MLSLKPLHRDFRCRTSLKFSTLHSPLSTLHSPLSPLSTLHSPLSTLHSPLSTLHSPLSTLHSPLDIQIPLAFCVPDCCASAGVDNAICSEPSATGAITSRKRTPGPWWCPARGSSAWGSAFDSPSATGGLFSERSLFNTAPSTKGKVTGGKFSSAIVTRCGSDSASRSTSGNRDPAGPRGYRLAGGGPALRGVSHPLVEEAPREDRRHVLDVPGGVDLDRVHTDERPVSSEGVRPRICLAVRPPGTG